MRTIGEVIKQARVKKRLSRTELQKQIKIKKEFIEALEKENWQSLPELPVIQGFIKNIASALDINQKQLLAFLRRDYPPKALRINPKPDVEPKPRWNPRLSFLLGIITVTLAIFVYLGYQYTKFMAPPSLEVQSPKEGQLVTSETLTVSGLTGEEVVILVNNQPVLIDEGGKFSTEIEVFEKTEEVVVKATSRSGKETVVTRRINVELE